MPRPLPTRLPCRRQPPACPPRPGWRPGPWRIRMLPGAQRPRLPRKAERSTRRPNRPPRRGGSVSCGADPLRGQGGYPSYWHSKRVPAPFPPTTVPRDETVQSGADTSRATPRSPHQFPLESRPRLRALPDRSLSRAWRTPHNDCGVLAFCVRPSRGTMQHGATTRLWMIPCASRQPFAPTSKTPPAQRLPPHGRPTTPVGRQFAP